MELCQGTGLAQGRWSTLRAFSGGKRGELHGDKNNISKQTALDEKGAVVNGRGEDPNQYVICSLGHSTTAPLCQDGKMRPAVNWTVAPTARAA